MRLRRSINPPERYDSEDFIASGQQSSRRQNREQRRRLVDFDYTLPPAVFPSLEMPRGNGIWRSSLSSDDNIQHTETSGQSQSRVQGEKKGGNDADIEGTRDFDDKSIRQAGTENEIASNGEMNPIYMRNLNVMANLVENPYAEMEDSDSDHTLSRNQAPGLLLASDPQWRDLSSKMKAEILTNLLLSHSFSRVCRLLGLSAYECNSAHQLLALPNSQIEIENSALEKMRTRQIRALMRVDNSALRQNRVPFQLIFHKASRQCTRMLKKITGSDYLLCQSGELLLARRFLQKRGIDRRYAGNWGNSMVTLRAPASDLELETFEWKMNLASRPCSPEEDARPSSEEAEQFSRQLFINDAGKALDADLQDSTKREGGRLAPPRWLDGHRDELRREKLEQVNQACAKLSVSRFCGMVRLRIGSERDARIQCGEYGYLAQEDVSVSSCGSLHGSASWISSEPPRESATVNHHVFPNTGAVITEPLDSIRGCPIARAEPVLVYPGRFVRRVTGGSWSYNPVDQSQNPRSLTLTQAIQKANAIRTGELKKKAQRERGLCEAFVFAEKTQSMPPLAICETACFHLSATYQALTDNLADFGSITSESEAASLGSSSPETQCSIVYHYGPRENRMRSDLIC